MIEIAHFSTMFKIARISAIVTTWERKLFFCTLSSSLLFLKLSLALHDLMLLPWPYMLMHGIHMYLEPLYSSEIDGSSSGIIGGSILTRSLT